MLQLPGTCTCISDYDPLRREQCVCVCVCVCVWRVKGGIYDIMDGECGSGMR